MHLEQSVLINKEKKLNHNSILKKVAIPKTSIIHSEYPLNPTQILNKLC